MLKGWLPGLVLAADGGWSAVLRVPSIDDDEAFALECLERAHLLVHPGYFYDFETPGHLVLSVLPPAPIFHDGVTRLRQVLEKRRPSC